MGARSTGNAAPLKQHIKDGITNCADEVGFQQGKVIEEAISRTEMITSCFVAFVMVSSALIAMYHEADLITYIALMFPLVTGPYMVHQTRQLNKHIYAKEDLERWQEHKVQLIQDNCRLQEEEKELRLKLHSLKSAEAKMENLIRHQQARSWHVHQLVSENGEISRQIKKLKEAEKLQELVKSMHHSGDIVMGMNEEEMKELLQILQNCSPRKLDERKMRKTVGKEVFDYFENFSEYEAFDFPRASRRSQMPQMKLNRPIL